MSGIRVTLLQRLADGAIHSGQALAAELGVSRAAVGKQITRLRTQGWPVEARRGAGYRLPPPWRPLDRARIEAAPGFAAASPESLAVLDEVDSTSAWLDRGPVPASGRARLCIAERQQAGRGRRGRTWYSAPGASITFSAVRTVDRSPAELGALGLAVGVGIGEALAALGMDGIGLKWPNDLVHDDRKLGGILIEFRGEAAGVTRTTVGVGINYNDPIRAGGSTWTTLRAIAGERLPDRSRLAGSLMAAVVTTVESFERDGFSAFRERWDRFDRLAGRAVRVWTDREVADGIARGIADDGALVFEDGDGRRGTFHGAEVTIRARA